MSTDPDTDLLADLDIEPEEFDPVATLRQLLHHEVDQERPNFDLMRLYSDALKKAQARANQLSVDSIDMVATTRADLMVNGGNIVMAGNDNEQMDATTYRARRDRTRDHQLGALEDIARRAGPDPLAALLASYETVTSLYSPEEWESLAERLRAAVEARLPRLPPREATA